MTIDELMERYRNLDDVDRQRIWLAVIAVIVLIYLLISLEDSMNLANQYIGKGAQIANESAEGLKGIGGPPS